MPWKLTVRAGSRVQRASFEVLEDALAELERQVGELAAAAPKKSLDVRFRRFEPAELVSARLELAGPERLVPRTRAGIDVRADGSTAAYIGRVRREVLAPMRGESPYRALRRELTQGAELTTGGTQKGKWRGR